MKGPYIKSLKYNWLEIKTFFDLLLFIKYLAQFLTSETNAADSHDLPSRPQTGGGARGVP